jgi:dihydrofolate reductase
MRELVYYVATTLDGFIAHPDGSFGGFPWDEEYGADLLSTFPETFPTHLRPDESAALENLWFDTALMGRKTYEVGLEAGITNPYATLKQYVFSRTMKRSPDARVVLVSEAATEFVSDLKKQPGQAIWLCGGSDLASTLFSAGLIDRLIIKLNPVVFGSGIPLLGAGIEPTTLALTDSKVYRSGHVLLHYAFEASSDAAGPAAPAGEARSS